MEIIPAIDIIEGKCVRLSKGNFEQKKIYNEHPLEVAKQFEDAGLLRLHLVDLDGAKEGRVRNWKTLEEISSRTSLQIDFGGGIQTEKDVLIVLNSGAALVTIGSMAVKHEELFLEWVMKFGNDKFFLGADVREEKIAVHGWQEITQWTIYDFIQKYSDKKLNNIFCTDISRDGLLEGPSIDLYKKIIEKFPELRLTASGGVSKMQDLVELDEIGCAGVIIGKAIYEGRISVVDLSNSNYGCT
ncbi:MAG: 1-(5-phosphoribosyl)-5-[(5-phosphoribosylamino)methylideneamino]imidazole-4-carboxamide isomerase [Chitinophagales bacterium]